MSPKMRKKNKMAYMRMNKTKCDLNEINSQSLEIKAWNSNKLTRVTAGISYRQPANIFCLSNRSSSNKLKHKSQRSVTLSNSQQMKPGTAPHRLSKGTVNL